MEKKEKERRSYKPEVGKGYEKNEKKKKTKKKSHKECPYPPRGELPVQFPFHPLGTPRTTKGNSLLWWKLPGKTFDSPHLLIRSLFCVPSFRVGRGRKAAEPSRLSSTPHVDFHQDSRLSTPFAGFCCCFFLPQPTALPVPPALFCFPFSLHFSCPTFFDCRLLSWCLDSEFCLFPSLT